MPTTTAAARTRLKHTIQACLKRSFKPQPTLTLSEWSEQRRYLSREASAEPGRWKNSRVPYLREMMDEVTNPATHTIVAMMASQTGKTEGPLLNAVGYFIDQDPAPIMWVSPRVDDCKDISKNRLAPMIRDTPCLHGRVMDAKSRDSGNTILQKQFHGGHLTLVGANAPAGLAQRPIRIVLADEVDRYPASAGTEGDPIALVRARQATFWNRKMVMVSSPTIEGISRIAREYALSDQRQWQMPCPHCDEFQRLKWEQVKWDKGEPLKAYIECGECGGVIAERDRQKMIKRGKWVAQAEFRGIAGFHVSALDSPFANIGELARQYEDSRGDAEQEKVFENTKLARLYRERGERPDAERIYERRESYRRGVVPDPVAVLTAAVDVQGDRLECEVIGWGPGTESWSIDYITIPGDPELDSVWRDLSEVLHRTWPGEKGGSYRLARMAIDSGFATSRVYAWAEREWDNNRVYVIKGTDNLPAAVGRPTSPEVDSRGKGKAKRKVRVWPVGSSFLKRIVYSRLRIAKPSEGEPCPRYMHKPEYDREYFEQLCAEQELTVSDKRGFPKRVWQKLHSRNEALDLNAYNLAMCINLGLESKTDEWFHDVRASTVDAPTIEQMAVLPEQAPVRKRPKTLVQGGKKWF